MHASIFTNRLLQKMCIAVICVSSCVTLTLLCLLYRLLGEGAFGEVIAGTVLLPDDPEPKPVAIKVSPRFLYTVLVNGAHVYIRYVTR